MQLLVRRGAIDFLILACTALLVAASAAEPARAQQASISAWDAADFRVWGYIPYWANATTINNFATNGMYTHVSDVLYFGAVRPDAEWQSAVCLASLPDRISPRSGRRRQRTASSST